MANEKTAVLEEQMRAWPSLEDTEQQVTQAIRQIADAATAIDPALQFREHRDRTSGTCKGDFAKTKGISVIPKALLSDATISDASWPQILAEARKIAGTIGTTEIEVRVDKPGHHDIRLYSDKWTEIHLATFGRSRIGANTGCRFTQADLGTLDSN